jgi:hypothetical protein
MTAAGYPKSFTLDVQRRASTFVNDNVGRPRRVHVNDHDHDHDHVYVDVNVYVHVDVYVHVNVYVGATSLTEGRGPPCLVGEPPR